MLLKIFKSYMLADNEKVYHNINRIGNVIIVLACMYFCYMMVKYFIIGPKITDVMYFAIGTIIGLIVLQFEVFHFAYYKSWQKFYLRGYK